jgi:hypothetical protein
VGVGWSRQVGVKCSNILGSFFSLYFHLNFEAGKPY